MKKRILSILLTLCMVLSVVTPLVFAAENGQSAENADQTREPLSLEEGETYWFDISGMINGFYKYYESFVYVGTVDSYVLNAASAGNADSSAAASAATDSDAPYGYCYDHRLFASAEALEIGTDWNGLYGGSVIFGKPFESGGLTYTLRAPTVGSGVSEEGTVIPENNEWDAIRNKGYIKGNDSYCWGQDTFGEDASKRSSRRFDNGELRSEGNDTCIRPVLEIPAELTEKDFKVVTLDLNGGYVWSTAGRTSGKIKIIVKAGQDFSAPVNSEMYFATNLKKNNFHWRDENGNIYRVGDPVPVEVNTLTACWTFEEKFSFEAGSTYYFNLSEAGISGSANTDFYGGSLDCVPFTYAGTVDTYAQKDGSSAGVNGSRSLLVANYNVTRDVSWDELNKKGFIFGKPFESGGITYTMRAPSAGTDSYLNKTEVRGTPWNNEWDTIRVKGEIDPASLTRNYIKNWQGSPSWGQDAFADDTSMRVYRGGDEAGSFASGSPSSGTGIGYRPILEIPDEIEAEDLRAVTINLNKGKLGGDTGPVRMIARQGASFTAPTAKHLTDPEGNPASADFVWVGDDGNTYAPGSTVAGNVRMLVARWSEDSIGMPPVPYLDENGQMQGCFTYTELTSYFEPDIKNNPFYDLPAGWYVISGDVTVTSRIRLNGDVKFILTDGAQLDAKWGIDLGAGDTFTVYGQTDDAETMGKLTACIPDAIDLYGIPKEEKEEAEWISEFRNNTPGIGMKSYHARRDGRTRGVSRDEGDVIINGGHIKVKAGTGASGIGGTGDMRYPSEGIKGGNITINGGIVDASTGSYLASALDSGVGIGTNKYELGGSVTINGGTVIAKGVDCGIGAGKGGNITINGGDVTAIAGVTEDSTRYYWPKGIGIGLWHDGTVTINGGNINASTVYSGAGIGGYYADVAIHGGNIEATGSGESNFPPSVGIGSGKSLLIDGGVIHAYGKGGAAGIGGANVWKTEKYTENASLLITGGEIYVSAEGNGAAIGGTSKLDYGSITIIGNAVKSLTSESGPCIGASADKSVGDITITDADLPLFNCKYNLIGGNPLEEGNKILIQNSRVMSVNGNDTYLGISVGNNGTLIVENSEISLPKPRSIQGGDGSSIILRDSEIHTCGIYMKCAGTLKKVEITDCTVVTGAMIGGNADNAAVGEIVIRGSDISMGDDHYPNRCCIGSGKYASFKSIDIQDSKLHLPVAVDASAIGGGWYTSFKEDARIRIANSTVDATTYRLCPAIGAGYHATGDATLEIIIENSNVIAKGGTLRSGNSGTYVPGIGKDSYSKWLNVKIQITDSTVESLCHTKEYGEEPDDYRIYDGLHEKNLPGIPEENMTFCGSTVNGKRFDHDVDAYGKCRICGKYDLGYCYEKGLLRLSGLENCVFDGSEKKLTRLAHRTDPEVLTVLEEGTDYTVTYKNNIYPYALSPDDAGFDSAKAPKVTICGTGSFCGRAEHCFTIGGQAQPSYTVRFETNGGTAIADRTDVKWTNRVLENIESPKRPGYYFAGWMCGETAVHAATTYADLAGDESVQSVTLTALWEATGFPWGEIRIDERNAWQRFLNLISFGLFFREEKTVTVTAGDASGEDVEVEYFIGDKMYFVGSWEGNTFAPYTGPIGIDADGKYAVYVKLTNASGKVTYLSSDGFVIDTTAPVIQGVEAGKVYCDEVTATIVEENIDTVTVGGEPVTLDENKRLVIPPANGDVTIAVTDKLGYRAEITVTVYDGHDLDPDTNICTHCGIKVAADLKLGDSVTHFGTVTEALTEACKSENSGCTVKIWARNTMLPDGFYADTDSVGFTLDLNGKSLSGYPLNVGGAGRSGKLTVIDSRGNGTLGLAVRDGGEVTAGGSKDTTYSIAVYGGTLKFTGGHITAGMCDLYNGVKLTDLLPEGYAYRRYDGIGTEFSKNSWVSRADAENRTGWAAAGQYDLAVMKCEHVGMDSDGNCPYCGLKIAAAITKPGIFRGYTDINEAISDAQSDENYGCALTLCNGEVRSLTLNKGRLALEIRGAVVEYCTISGADVTIDRNMDAWVTFTGGKLSITGGIFTNYVSLKSSEARISGGQFADIDMTENSKVSTLAGYLGEGRAFADKDSGEIVNGYVTGLKNVTVLPHAHDCRWNTETHEKSCACGYTEAADTEAPVVSGIENGKTYYGAAEFSVTDDNDFTVTVDGEEVQLTLGSYILMPDNKQHTVIATDVAGNTTSVTVTVNMLYKVTLSSGAGYTLRGDPLVGYGQEYTFTLEIAEGYSKTENFMVDVNGAPMHSDSGSYTISPVTSDIVITVFGVADITPPAAEITISTNKFNSFMNTITFGLFFKKTQTVTVTASDNGSGLEKVEYLLSETAFEDKDAIVGDWTELTLTEGTASFNIEPDRKAYVYLRVTDAGGNVSVINSDGVVVYTDAEAITEAVSFTKLDGADVSFRVSLNGNTVAALYNGDTLLDSADYTVSADGTVTLKNSYLSALAAGEYTVRAAYNPLGEEYRSGDEPAVTTIKLTVSRKTPSISHVSGDAKNYDGNPISVPAFNTDSDGASAVEYKPADADDSAYTAAAPKNVGKYIIRITTAETDTFKAAFSTMAFEIKPREVTIFGVTAGGKTYDGNAKAKITAAGVIDGLVDGDKVDIVTGKALYHDKNVGNGKTVTFYDFALSGDDAANYVLSAQPAGTTASISARELTIKNLAVKDKQYDGKNSAEIDGTPALVGVVDGDMLTLVNGVPTFDSVKIGKNIAISFTAFTLSGDSVTVGNYTLTQPTGITASIVEYSADGSEYEVNSNDWINTDFVITAKAGYKLGLTDTANGEWADSLTASDETGNGKLTFFVKNTGTGVISAAVTENYKIDKTAPTGEVKLNERTAFQKFINKITFGLFFKDDVHVKLTAEDDASGVKSVLYFKSDKVLTDNEVRAITDWTDNSDFDIEAKDMDKFVIYVRIEDNAGNVTFIGSDGATFDTAAPEIIGIENGKTYYVTKKVAIDDENLEAATLNGESVEEIFLLVGDTEATYFIRAVDKAGNVTEYTVYMKPLSSVTDAVSGITVGNVRSSDAETISAVERQILDIAEAFDDGESTEEEWNKLTEAAAKCKDLNRRIADVADEITRLTDTVNGYDIDKVTSADKADIEKLISDIDALLNGNNLTESERTALEALKGTARALLDRIAAAKDAAEDDEITSVKDITKDNVKLRDKEPLEKAEKALEGALRDFGGNYTEEENKELETKLETVKAALAAIGNAEKAADEIGKLPSTDDAKLSDKSDLDRVKKLLEGLTENEKAMLDKDALGKVDALAEKIQKLAEEANSPKTGDTSNLALWIALLFISGGIVTGTTVVSKKKKRSVK